MTETILGFETEVKQIGCKANPLSRSKFLYRA
jgi:hypothetical protein